MTVMPLHALGVTTTGGAASVLATILTVSTTPAALLLEELARTQIHLEVLGRANRELTTAEHHRLDAGPITAGHHRTALLRTASGLVAAETSLLIVPQRIPSHARAALAGTRTPAARTPPAASSRSSPPRSWPSTASRSPSPPNRSPASSAS